MDFDFDFDFDFGSEERSDFGPQRGYFLSVSGYDDLNGEVRGDAV